MKYSEVKERLKIVHRFEYKKVRGLPMYEKYFRLNHYYTIYTISSSEVLYLHELVELLKYVEKQKWKQILIHVTKQDRFFT